LYMVKAKVNVCAHGGIAIHVCRIHFAASDSTFIHACHQMKQSRGRRKLNRMMIEMEEEDRIGEEEMSGEERAK